MEPTFQMIGAMLLSYSVVAKRSKREQARLRSHAEISCGFSEKFCEFEIHSVPVHPVQVIIAVHARIIIVNRRGES